MHKLPRRLTASRGFHLPGVAQARGIATLADIGWIHLPSSVVGRNISMPLRLLPFSAGVICTIMLVHWEINHGMVSS